MKTRVCRCILVYRYVYIYLRIFVFMYICMFSCMYVSMYVCIHVLAVMSDVSMYLQHMCIYNTCTIKDYLICWRK